MNTRRIDIWNRTERTPNRCRYASMFIWSIVDDGKQNRIRNRDTNATRITSHIWAIPVRANSNTYIYVQPCRYEYNVQRQFELCMQTHICVLANSCGRSCLVSQQTFIVYSFSFCWTKKKKNRMQNQILIECAIFVSVVHFHSYVILWCVLCSLDSL